MKTVLFVCKENSCRSQMAEGFVKILGKGIIEAYSAGSSPAGQINPNAVEVMKEVGIDISGQFSKGFSQLPVKNFDFVITLGCKDICPFVPAKEYIAWNIADPKGKDINFFRQVRNVIKEKIERLLEDINAS